ncbi:hypothetical protein EJB05_14694 [Eragrostis curvula]|uniref:Translation initiation factor 3 N-terminal domain-containing protein n=1 Tax=Eragrostis curvula TaxID=38414 RepID=A0A5J9VZW0_9POAL|nr:hypothetical protein EJB05_14694 [Eragrostis curvula]
MALPLRRGVGSLALRSFAASLRRHAPSPPPPPLENLFPAAPAHIRRTLAPPCRHFAAPPQANKKSKEDDDEGPRVNNAITAPFVRLVTDDGHKVVSRKEALDLAARMEMDLVEVHRKSDPPVCKIMDFHKEKYKKDVKEKERLKTKSAIVLRGGDNKEVRFKGKTELKDLMVKADAITRLMERGYRVKCMAMPSGNEGEDLGAPLSRLLGLIQDVCIVESGPHLDSKHAYVIVRHVKFATKKGGKKASKAMEDAGKGTHGAGSESPVAGDNKDEPIECVTEAGDRATSAQKGGQDRDFKRNLNQSVANPGDREKLRNTNSGGSRANPGQWGPQTPEHRHGSKDAKPDMERRENNNQVKEPGEANRYAARRPPVRGDNQGFSQGRSPQDHRRNENEGCYAVNDNQRPLEQHNRPVPRFNQGRLPQDPRNERRGQFPLNNSQRQPPGGDSGSPNRTTEGFGIFSTPKHSSSEPRKTNDAPASKPDSPKSYGIFSSSKR